MDHVITTVIRRRLTAMSLFLIIDQLQRQHERRRRCLWSQNWLLRRDMCDNNTVLNMLFNELGPEDPKSFQNFTRMEQDIMDELLNIVTPFIRKQNTVMREAISPEMRLSVTLRYLATGNSLQDLAYSTRIASNTLSQIIPETLSAIITVLERKVLSFPSKPENWLVIAEKFQNIWQSPHCVGALDGKHIVFRPPRSEGSKYSNYKGTDSIILLALVDAEYKFIFVDIGKNGRIHDSRAFRESPLGIKLTNNDLHLPEPSALPNFNHKVPYVIVGDDAFSLHVNLMKPYPERGLTQEKRIFNYRLSRARRIVENAFGILVKRFRILLNPIPLCVEKVEIITYACVILHNYLLSKRTPLYVGCTSKNLVIQESGLRSVGQQGGNHSSVVAGEIRDLFFSYFNNIGAVSWQYDAIESGNC